MSTEVKRLRSTICNNLTETSTVVSSCNQSWDRLPLEIAVDIYRLLPTGDKHKMSLTSKFWLSVFRHPGSWRSSHFVFTGSPASSRPEIPDQVLSSLRYVTIDCSVPRRDESEDYLMEKTQSIVQFVAGLKRTKNTTLWELTILDMEQLGPHVLRNRLHYHLSTLLVKQTRLSKLSLLNAGLRKAQGLKLLTAAGQNSARHLKYINVRNFSKQTVHPELRFAEICSTYTHLTELSLNYGFMSDDLLNHLSGTLKLIIVCVHPHDFSLRALGGRYSDNGWKVLVSKSTDLKAEYHLENLNSFVSLRCVLLPTVPLATLYWCTQARAPNRIRLCFEYIINSFMVPSAPNLFHQPYVSAIEADFSTREHSGPKTAEQTVTD